MDLQKLLDDCFQHVILKDDKLKFKDFPYEVKRKLSEKHKIALILANLNYQWENGGISQWHFNGYADRDFDDIVELMEEGTRIGFEECKKIYELLNEFNDFFNDFSEYSSGFEEHIIEEYTNELHNLDRKYYSIENRIEVYEKLIDEYEKGKIQLTN